jgi:hypothetical protein
VIVVEMETVKLSDIVMRLTPELYPSLTELELETSIVLRDGFKGLRADDAREIVRQSICKHQKDALIH